MEVGVLTAALARGDEAAFHEFHRLYFDRLFRYLLVVGKGREEAVHEALQATFVRVARHVRRFDSEPAFWNWLALLARRALMDEGRKQTRYRSMLGRFLQQRSAEPPASEEFEERLAQLLQIEIAALPPAEKSLIEGKYFNGEPIRVLADARQLTEKAMESRLLRIRRKLKNAVLGRLRDETTD
jgi:RNA polymerase sigma-70 factor (ECF subfamily)